MHDRTVVMTVVHTVWSVRRASVKCLRLCQSVNEFFSAGGNSQEVSTLSPATEAGALSHTVLPTILPIRSDLDLVSLVATNYFTALRS